jgi:hypothetical protein
MDCVEVKMEVVDDDEKEKGEEEGTSRAFYAWFREETGDANPRAAGRTTERGNA